MSLNNRSIQKEEDGVLGFIGNISVEENGIIFCHGDFSFMIEYNVSMKIFHYNLGPSVYTPCLVIILIHKLEKVPFRKKPLE